VDQNVDVAEHVDCPLDQRVPGLAAAQQFVRGRGRAAYLDDVERDAVRRGAVAAGSRRVDAGVMNHHLRTASRQQFGIGGCQTASRAGDQGDLAIEIDHLASTASFWFIEHLNRTKAGARMPRRLPCS